MSDRDRDRFPTLFVMVGPPGSGKTTFARRMRTQRPGVGIFHPDTAEVISRDEVRMPFGNYSPKKEIEVMRIIEGTVKGHLLRGGDVIVDANHCAIGQRAQVLQWTKDLWCSSAVSVRNVLVWLPVTFDESLARKPDLDVSVIQKQHDAFTEPRIEEGAHVVRVESALESPIGPLFNLPLTPHKAVRVGGVVGVPL